MGVLQAKAEPADADGSDENVNLGPGPEVGAKDTPWWWWWEFHSLHGPHNGTCKKVNGAEIAWLSREYGNVGIVSQVKTATGDLIKKHILL